MVGDHADNVTGWASREKMGVSAGDGDPIGAGVSTV